MTPLETMRAAIRTLDRVVSGMMRHGERLRLLTEALEAEHRAGAMGRAIQGERHDVVMCEVCALIREMRRT